MNPQTNRSRGILIAGNWKMNHGAQATRDFATALGASWSTRLSDQTRAALSDPARLRALIFPPFLSLPAAQAALANLPIAVGAQNVHWEDKGAFTGEISGEMLRELAADGGRPTDTVWTLVGHSERRQYFAETDETVKKRAESHLKQGFHVVLCIGETRSEREGGETEMVIRRQLANGLPDAWSSRLVIAYEPVWAIGTGLTATPEQAEEAHAFTRGELSRKYGPDAASRTPILYGGSVTPENVAGLLAKPNVDGGLVGGASLKPDGFLTLLEAAGHAL